MKSLVLATVIIILSYGAFILITQGNFIIATLILLVAFERFIPLYKEFKGRKIFKKIIK